MELARLQHLLSRLYTDHKLRKQVIEDPQHLASLGLNSEEIAEMVVMFPEIKRFASTLYKKRYHQVLKLLPITHKAIPEEFPQQFSLFSQEYIPYGPGKHAEDAIIFVRYLLSNKKLSLIDWQRQAMSYERHCLEMINRRHFFRIRLFRYYIPDVLQNTPPRSKWCCAIWFRNFSGILQHGLWTT